MTDEVRTACFEGATFKGLTDGLRKKYQYYWNTFETIFKFDVNVSTMKSVERIPLTYWTYESDQQKLAYRNGEMLHIRVYPTSNWNVNRD